MTHTTKLEHARVFKKMGLPLNMHVEEAVFSHEYSMLWVELMNAHDRFMRTLRGHSNRPHPRKWQLLNHRLFALADARERCLPFLEKLGGNVRPPVFQSLQDERE